MDILVFREKLINTVIMRCRPLLVVLLLIVTFLIFDVIYKKKTRTNCGLSLTKLFTNNKHFTPRFTLNQQMIMKVIGAFIICVMICVQVIATYVDVHSHQYIELHVQSIQDIMSEKSLFSCGQMCVIDSDGKQLFLNLPADFMANDYPIGVGGTIWYAKETKVVLAFTPVSQE